MKDRKIDLLGTTYQVKFVDLIEVNDDGSCMMGECDSSIQLIRVCKKDRLGNPLSEELIKQNLCHEIVHAILNEGQYLNQSEDEPMVEWLGRNIYQLFKQKVL